MQHTSHNAQLRPLNLKFKNPRPTFHCYAHYALHKQRVEKTSSKPSIPCWDQACRVIARLLDGLHKRPVHLFTLD